MHEGGYIALWRKFEGHPFWHERREFSKAEAWIDVLWTVRWQEEPTQVVKGMRVIEVGYGQYVASLSWWARRWHWSKAKVIRYFSLCEELNMIRTESVTKSTRLTVCNYGSYDPRRTDGEPIVNRWRTDGEPIANRQYSKKGKKDKKEVPPVSPRGEGTRKTKADLHDEAVASATIPASLDTPEFRELWATFCDERRQPRKYMTQAAAEQNLAKLEEAGPAAACQALRDSIAGGYQGVFPKRVKPSKQQALPANWQEPDDYDEQVRRQLERRTR